jgi:glutathione peroxidase
MIFDHPIHTLKGEPSSLAALKGKTLLLVNVASKCGLTPQYRGLVALHEEYGPRGLAVIGFPCNQFGAQEPGTPQEIESFCSANYGVKFQMMEKIDVNGPNRHPIYKELTAVADAEGTAGDVQWNFEKFVVSPDGATITRFRPVTSPEDPKIVRAIEAGLGG